MKPIPGQVMGQLGGWEMRQITPHLYFHLFFSAVSAGRSELAGAQTENAAGPKQTKKRLLTCFLLLFGLDSASCTFLQKS
jgi:hypothetical protein